MTRGRTLLRDSVVMKQAVAIVSISSRSLTERIRSNPLSKRGRERRMWKGVFTSSSVVTHAGAFLLNPVR